jgi:hypothetical protein
MGRGTNLKSFSHVDVVEFVLISSPVVVAHGRTTYNFTDVSPGLIRVCLLSAVGRRSGT